MSAQLYPLKSVADVPDILTHNVFVIKMTVVVHDGKDWWVDKEPY